VALAGREEELGRIAALQAEVAAGRCRTLLLEGEPGVGKTTLLELARATAEGFTCLSAQGAEVDAALAYAGLLQLLRPVQELLPAVPDAQAAALKTVLGWSSAPVAADRFLVAAATLSLLAAAAERGPVLVLVDDLQWLDRESAEAVVFAARRLGPDAVGFLLTARTGSGLAELLAGVPVLPVVGLPVSALPALLAGELAPDVLERLAAGTSGNPLAILETARLLSDAQRIGAAPLPDPLPTGAGLRRQFETTLAGLSPNVWRVVLLVALCRAEGAAATVRTVLTANGIDAPSALDEACQHAVLVRHGGRYQFRHPLLRSAVLARATAAEQRAAHAALGQALPVGDRAQVWHSAESVVGAHAHLADELSRIAEADRYRLGYAAASVALERAGDLTPDPDLAARRLAVAAHDALLAGDVARVHALAHRVISTAAPGRVRGDALFTLGMLEQYAGSVPLSVEHLADASNLLDGPELVRALTELAIARFRLNDVAGFIDCARRIDAVADSSDPEQQLLAAFTGGASLVLTGDPEPGMARLAQVRRLAELPILRHDARALILMALATTLTGELGDAVRVGDARMHEVRRRGAIGVLVPCLAILAAAKAWLGDHAGAFADAGEASELAAHLGYAADAALAVETVAWQQASRGLHDDARAALTRARTLTDRAGTTSYAAHQALTAAYCALCRGDLIEVVSLLEQRIAFDGGVGPSGEPLGVAPLLVEAYAGLGRTKDARSMTDRYAAATPTPAPPLSTALVHRCEMLTAIDPTDAATAFQAAQRAHEHALDPFEEARTRLLYGSRLRRSGQRVAARTQLTQARDSFNSMELTHWATIAADELAATGATVRPRPALGPQPLTSQETRVALLAAKGLSNREIGASLFLSPKTVERHLSHVFRKRGYRSRTELAAAFAATTAL
jgi:DNA-binding CsgD family transcriptional regulator/tetratricopeptide (TPR) repeat protein